MYCHYSHPQFGGMNLVMQEGEENEMAPLPTNFNIENMITTKYVISGSILRALTLSAYH